MVLTMVEYILVVECVPPFNRFLNISGQRWALRVQVIRIYPISLFQLSKWFHQSFFQSFVNELVYIFIIGLCFGVLLLNTIFAFLFIG